MAWEEAFLIFLQDIRVDFLNPIMRFFSFLGNVGWFWIVICILLLIYKPTRPIGIIATVTLLISAGLCNGLIKHFVNRTRPYVAIEELKLIAKMPPDSSFPSGHSSASFAVACSITWCLTKKRKWVGAILIVIASLIAFSRLYVGAHYPTDVIVGVLLGIICSIVIYQVLHKKVLKNNELDENELELVKSEGING